MHDFILIVHIFIVAIYVSNALPFNEVTSYDLELTLSNNRYLIILFYDDSKIGNLLNEHFTEAVNSLDSNDLAEYSDVVKLSSKDPNIQEIIDAYSITVPTIKVFRRGIMSDYRGPLDSASNIANYIKEDCKPSVIMIDSLDQLKNSFLATENTVVLGIHLFNQSLNLLLTSSLLGFFNKENINIDDGIDTYSLDAWGQFQASADTLRGHASLYCISDEQIFESFGVDSSIMPVIYLLSDDENGLIQYNGVILEMNLSEWVLRNSSPRMNELSFATSKGEIFATQFFSSRKLKFILIIGSRIDNNDVHVANAISTLNEISELFKGIHSLTHSYSLTHSITRYPRRCTIFLYAGR